MFKSFSTALSGLSANATAIDVVSHNLANLNTVGFKTNDVAFRDLISTSISPGTNDTQVGFGTGIPATVRRFTQGTLQQSSGALDAAIQGDGFFVVRGSSGERLFTRAGNFQLDRNGFVRTLSGEYVQGWAVNSTGQLTGALTDISVPTQPLLPPVKTTEFRIDMNLNAAAAENSEFTIPVEVFDAQGNRSTLTIKMTKGAAANSWTASATTTRLDSSGNPVTVTLSPTAFTFDADGKLTAPTGDVTVTMGSETLNWRMNGSTITQYAAVSAVSANTQDGSGAAQLVRVGMGEGGQVVASYSNGTQRVVAQLALAAIRNPESMLGVGDNNLQATNSTAQPAIGEPGSGGRGAILAGALESSNVDLAREFTNLIAYQRGYQANSKIITTVDELSQDTINLKR